MARLTPKQKAIARATKIEASVYRQSQKSSRVIIRRLNLAKKELLATVRATGTSSWEVHQTRVMLGELEKNLADWNAISRGEMYPALNTAAVGGLSAVSQALAAGGVDIRPLGMQSTRFAQAAALHSADLLKDVSDDVIRNVSKILRQAALTSAPVIDVMRKIEPVAGKGVFRNASLRAETIVRTEMTRTMQVASQAGMRDVASRGGPKQKQWIATFDTRTRLAHAMAGGQIREVDLPYDVGKSALMYPGDPTGEPEDTVNCRCVSVPYDIAWENPGGDKAEKVEKTVEVDPPIPQPTGTPKDILNLVRDPKGRVEYPGSSARGWKGVDGMSGNPRLNRIIEAHGWKDAKPHVVSQRRLASYARKGETRMTRGVSDAIHYDSKRVVKSAQSMADDYRYGDTHSGSGIYGPGQYFAYGEQHTTAYGSSVRILRPLDVSVQFARKGGKVWQSTLRADARVIDQDDIGTAWTKWKKKSKLSRDELDDIERAFGTDSELAGVMGYDGLVVRGKSIASGVDGDQIIIINRAATRVSDKTINVTNDVVASSAGRSGNGVGTYGVEMKDVDARMLANVEKARTTGDRVSWEAFAKKEGIPKSDYARYGRAPDGTIDRSVDLLEEF